MLNSNGDIYIYTYIAVIHSIRMINLIKPMA